MIRRLLLGPYALAAPRLHHPNWFVRRTAQATILWVAMVSVALRRTDVAGGPTRAAGYDLVEQLSSSAVLRDFLHSPSIVRRLAGRVARRMVLRLAAVAKRAEIAGSGSRTFGLALIGPVDQKVLRNLLIWQNHVLPGELPADDGRQVDIVLTVGRGEDGGPRLFDLLSVTLMLARIRNVALIHSGESTANPLRMPGRESVCPSERATASLSEIPRDIIRRVELHGSTGGFDLLTRARKHANDFVKMALPGRLIVAVGLREEEDGTVGPGELERWLPWIDRLHAQQPDVGFVILNRLPPSQWRQWPGHVRFARHQGLTLQDAICLAQLADGYFGVLDIFGLAAHAADRPGVYIPLEEGEPGMVEPSEAPRGSRIMVGSRDAGRIEAALEQFFGSLASREA